MFFSLSKLSDSQDSACDVEFDEENSDDGFIDEMVEAHDDKVCWDTVMTSSYDTCNIQVLQQHIKISAKNIQK